MIIIPLIVIVLFIFGFVFLISKLGKLQDKAFAITQGVRIEILRVMKQKGRVAACVLADDLDLVREADIINALYSKRDISKLFPSTLKEIVRYVLANLDNDDK